jgi:hypothetical protein
VYSQMTSDSLIGVACRGSKTVHKPVGADNMCRSKTRLGSLTWWFACV